MAMVGGFKVEKGKFQSTIPGMTGHKVGGMSDETRKTKKQYEEFVWLLKG